MSRWDALVEIVLTPLGPISLLAALILVTFLYTNLSRRLGAVTKMPSYHRWFTVGGGFMALAMSASILRAAAHLSCKEEVAFLTSPQFGLFLVHVPLFIGVTISVVVTWRYWSWLLVGEREQPTGDA